ncbi:MAG TPA: PEP-CTERM sorting domain-containing protein [Phycisphaeraceae bacterium]
MVPERWGKAVRVGVAAVGLLTASGPAWAVTFQEIARIDLAPTSNPTNASYIGSHASAVAWNGSRLWVAGFNATGNTDNVGIVEVLDPLGTPSLGTAFGQISTPNLFSYTGLDVAGDTLAASYDNGAANANGVQAFSLDGTLRWKVGDTSGNFQGMSGVAIDPGFSGADSGVASTTFGSGRRWLWNKDTGANIYNGSNGMVITDGGSNASAWRDLDFAPNGDVWLRRANGVYRVVRTGGNSTGDKLLLAESPNFAFVVGQNISYLSGLADGDLVIYNSRTTTDIQAFADVVRLIQTDGTSEPLDITWLGDAPADGNGYYDFDYDPVTQTLALLDFANHQVHILAVPEPAGLALLGLGSVSLLRRRRG